MTVITKMTENREQKRESLDKTSLMAQSRKPRALEQDARSLLQFDSLMFRVHS